MQVFEPGDRAEDVEEARSDDAVVDDRAPAGGQPARHCSGSAGDHLVVVMGLGRCLSLFEALGEGLRYGGLARAGGRS